MGCRRHPRSHLAVRLPSRGTRNSGLPRGGEQTEHPHQAAFPAPQPAVVPISAHSSDPQVLIAYDAEIFPFQSTAFAPLYAARASTEPVGITVEVSTDPKGRAVTTLVRMVNPRPEVTSAYPPTLPAGSPGTSLFVFDSQFGLTFVTDSVVSWNGSPRPTRHGFRGGVCPDRCLDYLVIDLTPDDLALPGTTRISVINPSPGGGESDPFSFQIGPATVRSPVKRATGTPPAPPVKTASERPEKP